MGFPHRLVAVLIKVIQLWKFLALLGPLGLTQL
ncbi:MAG: hypothetical protein ACI9SP_004834 [Arenicella sp.]